MLPNWMKEAARAFTSRDFTIEVAMALFGANQRVDKPNATLLKGNPAHFSRIALGLVELSGQSDIWDLNLTPVSAIAIESAELRDLYGEPKDQLPLRIGKPRGHVFRIDGSAFDGTMTISRREEDGTLWQVIGVHFSRHPKRATRA